MTEPVKPEIDVEAMTPLQRYYYAEQLRCEVNAKYFDFLALRERLHGSPEGAGLGNARAIAERSLAKAWERLRENHVGDHPAVIIGAGHIDWADVVADPLSIEPGDVRRHPQLLQPLPHSIGQSPVFRRTRDDGTREVHICGPNGRFVGGRFAVVLTREQAEEVQRDLNTLFDHWDDGAPT